MGLAFVGRVHRDTTRGPRKDGGRTTRETEAVRRGRRERGERRTMLNKGWTEGREV